MKQRGYWHTVGCCTAGMAVILTITLVMSLTGADRLSVYAADVPTYTEDVILRASDAQAEDGFGFAVSIDGDTVVVGLGARAQAYVFVRDHGGAGQWGQVKILGGADSDVEDWFGRSVSISGDTIVVGARGAAYVFVRNEGGADQWGEVGTLSATDLQYLDGFGCSVSISGDTVVVGDQSGGDPEIGAGVAFVYERNHGGANQWGEVRVLRASPGHAWDMFGTSVSISGDTIVIGAYLEKAGETYMIEEGPGAAHVFERNAGSVNQWGEVSTLRASDLQSGDWFGESVSINGDTIVVGARREEGGEGDPLMATGAAYVFERNQGGADQWGEVRILRGPDPEDRFFGEEFGNSVSNSGDTIVIGAYNEDGGAGNPIQDAGAGYIFGRDAGGADLWGEVSLLRASDAQEGDWFGLAVSVSGSSVIVGAMHEDGGAGDPFPNAGAVYVFSGIGVHLEGGETAPSDDGPSEAPPQAADESAPSDDSPSEALPQAADEPEQGPAICPLLPVGLLLGPGMRAMARRRKIPK